MAHSTFEVNGAVSQSARTGRVIKWNALKEEKVAYYIDLGQTSESSTDIAEKIEAELLTIAGTLHTRLIDFRLFRTNELQASVLRGLSELIEKAVAAGTGQGSKNKSFKDRVMSAFGQSAQSGIGAGLTVYYSIVVGNALLIAHIGEGELFEICNSGTRPINKAINDLPGVNLYCHSTDSSYPLVFGVFSIEAFEAIRSKVDGSDLGIHNYYSNLVETFTKFYSKVTGGSDPDVVFTYRLKAMVSKLSEKDLLFVVETLKKSPIFNGIENKCLMKFCELGVVKTFAGGMEIYKKGDPGSALLILLDGSIDILDKGTVLRSHTNEGEPFGISGLFEGKRRSASIMAGSVTRMLDINIDDMWSFFLAEPVVGLALLSKFAANSQQHVRHWTLKANELSKSSV